MEKSWQLSVNVAFFMMGFVLFQFVFNSFLEVALRILETGRKKKEKRKRKPGEFLLMVCVLPKKPSTLVNKITSPIT